MSGGIIGGNQAKPNDGEVDMIPNDVPKWEEATNGELLMVSRKKRNNKGGANQRENNQGEIIRSQRASTMFLLTGRDGKVG